MLTPTEPDWTLLAAPFAAGLLILATHVPLGIEVLRRGIIFLDLAVAQLAALGAVAAGRLGWADGWQTQLAAGIAALLGAAVLGWMERRWPDIQEALIGLLFVAAAAGGVLLLAGDPHGGERLRDLLGGQVLWVGNGQIAAVAVLYVLLSAVWWLGGGGSSTGRFYALFALAVMASVQLAGVLLVFASLIAPAVATRALSGRLRFVVAWLLGVLGFALGLIAAASFDLPAGPAIVCCLAALAAATLAMPPRPVR